MLHCLKGKQDNTHLNVRGARLIARMVAEAIKETIPALAPHIVMYDYVVAKDGSGDFFTIQEAIDAVPDFRKKGVRRSIYGKVFIKKRLFCRRVK